MSIHNHNAFCICMFLYVCMFICMYMSTYMLSYMLVYSPIYIYISIMFLCLCLFLFHVFHFHFHFCVYLNMFVNTYRFVSRGSVRGLFFENLARDPSPGSRKATTRKSLKKFQRLIFWQDGDLSFFFSSLETWFSDSYFFGPLPSETWP